jgi:hypothetical protein
LGDVGTDDRYAGWLNPAADGIGFEPTWFPDNLRKTWFDHEKSAKPGEGLYR